MGLEVGAANAPTQVVARCGVVCVGLQSRRGKVHVEQHGLIHDILRVFERARAGAGELVVKTAIRPLSEYWTSVVSNKDSPSVRVLNVHFLVHMFRTAQ